MFYDNRDEPLAIARRVQRADLFVMRRGFAFLGREFIDGIPDLKFIHKTGSGLDWFDVPLLTERGILLANNDGFNAGSVSEHVVLLILLCLRNTFDHLTEMRRGRWSQAAPPGDVLSLEDKTVGIIGLGQIGSNIARRVHGFGARVVAFQPNPLPSAGILGDVRWLELDELLRTSDVVVPSVPLTAATAGLIGAPQLALMKPSAVLINCSRGPVVDESALYDALVSDRLRAAGLDVFNREPVSADNRLLGLRNVFATPHVAGHSSELEATQVAGALDNVERFLSGRRPLRLANPELLDRPRVNGYVAQRATA
jgi:phosphoglycerate dehydrogenase-like enzyme